MGRESSDALGKKRVDEETDSTKLVGFLRR